MESRKLRDRLQNSSGIGPLMGDDLAIAKAVRTLSKVATTAHPVLVLGESGTGKELVARSIHSNGPNATKPFIPVDCVSLAPNGIESELFGHTRGAFSGAQQSKEGILSAAGDGTVFFNEIGELPLDLQAKLFRALVERQIRPVGASHTIPISARIVAASNRDLFGMVANGRFRKDLYFRLNVYNIRIPALRDRKADIPLVANHFLKRISHEQKTANTFTDDAIQLMMHYPWPENVTELEKAVERACACSSGPFLTAADFPSPLQDHWRNCVQEAAQESARIRQFQPLPDITPLADIEKKTILDAIRKSRGDKLLAARLLQIGKTTLYRKLKEYDTTNN
jgi:two-component system response regulator HydG